MKRIIGWKCDTCNAVTELGSPWNCVGCGKEICDSCFYMYGHCRPCCQGATELELAKRANAKGDFDFDIDGIVEGLERLSNLGTDTETGSAPK